MKYRLWDKTRKTWATGHVSIGKECAISDLVQILARHYNDKSTPIRIDLNATGSYKDYELVCDKAFHDKDSIHNLEKTLKTANVQITKYEYRLKKLEKKTLDDKHTIKVLNNDIESIMRRPFLNFYLSLKRWIRA